MKIGPFHFRLKNVSSEEVRLIDAIFEYLPATGMRDNFSRGVASQLARHLGEDFSLTLDSVLYEEYDLFLSKLPSPVIMAVVGLAPVSHKAILEVDSHIALCAIERLLGGDFKSLPQARTLSDTEQGVFEYLILDVLAYIHNISGKDARVHFRFDRFSFSAHEVRDLGGRNKNIAVLVFRATLGRHAGFVRLCLPDPFVEEVFLKTKTGKEARPAEEKWLKKNLARFSFIHVSLWAEAGRASLTQADASELEEGDIILFDQSDISITEGRPGGSVVLRVGEGLGGGFDAELSTENNTTHCRITGFHKGE